MSSICLTFCIASAAALSLASLIAFIKSYPDLNRNYFSFSSQLTISSLVIKFPPSIRVYHPQRDLEEYFSKSLTPSVNQRLFSSILITHFLPIGVMYPLLIMNL